MARLNERPLFTAKGMPLYSAMLSLAPLLLLAGWIADWRVEQLLGTPPDADGSNPIIRHILRVELVRKFSTYALSLAIFGFSARRFYGTGHWRWVSRVFVLMLVLEFVGRVLSGCGAEGGDLPVLLGDVPALGPLFYAAPLLGLAAWSLLCWSLKQWGRRT